jgi:Mor family transcriptional regulator
MIYRRVERGETLTHLAKSYEVSLGTIRYIVRVLRKQAREEK